MNSKEPESESPHEILDLDPEILKKAEEGNSFAQLDVGKAWYFASTGNNNLEKAFYLFILSAEQRNMEAQFRLGDMFALGDGTEKNEFTAYDWYLESALQGYPKALTRLHNLYHAEKSMYSRGQRNSKEEKWTTADFKKENNIRELYEYRVQQLESELTKLKDYFKRLLSACREIIDDDEIENKEYAYLKLGFLYQHGYGIKKIKTRAIEFYTLSAENGNIDAAYNLGHIYQYSPRAMWNYRKAFKWYTEAVEKGHAYAYNGLAFLYLKGLGTDMNYSTAIGLYTKSAENRNINAMISLARIFRQGKIVQQDYKKSADWYKKAIMEDSSVAQSSLELLIANKHLSSAEIDSQLMSKFPEVYSKKGLISRLRSDISTLGEFTDLEKLKKLAMNAMKGDSHAMFEIGMKYYNGDDLAQDKNIAFKWIRNAAKSGITSIQCFFAKMYKDGDCVEQNYHKASIWYEKAAKQGDPDARYNLGLLYYHGLGVRKDPLEASRWYTFASNKNNSDAQCQLGILRENGEGLRQDLSEAFQWFNVSLQQKNSQAIFRLARMYEHGILKERNTKKALVLYKISARLGNLDAQLKLGNLYNWYQNKITASNYYKMAANQGNPEAKYKLAILYLDGKGVGEDLIKAYHLFKETSDLGYENSINIFNIPIDYSKTNDLDYSKVIKMFELICENRIDSLEYNIGSYYNKDTEFTYNNVPHLNSANDLSKQLWYEAAAKKGVPEAHQKLAVMFEKKDKFFSALKHYKDAYNLGNTDATYKLACMYLNGCHVFQNFKKAFSLLNQASDKGHKEAYKILNPVKYDNQNGNIGLVKEMFQISADSGNVISQYKLGVLTLRDKSQEHRIQEAITWLYKASRGGFIEASYCLGLLFEENAAMEKDYLEIIRLYETAADKGHEKALFRLAQLYHFGERVERNYLKAFEFYTSAAQQKYQPAELAINIISEPTWNDKKKQLTNDSENLCLDYDSCFRMWKYVADKGNFDLQYKLGVVYEENGGDLNMVQAANWYSKAVCSSHEDALNNLGRLYEIGQGVPQNYKKAIELYERSSELDNSQALYKLGVIYHSGKGVKPDLKVAHTYFTRAARKGNSKAQFELGKLYEEGTFLPQNKLEALKQFSLSSSQGNTDAELWLKTYYDGVYDDYFLYRQQLNLLNQIIKQEPDAYYKDISLFGAANYELGKMYYYGYGAPVDYEKAWKYWKSSVLYGDSRARDILAIKYENIDIKIKDSYLKKLEMFEAVAEQLSVENIYMLGSIYQHGVYSKQADLQTDNIEVIVQPDHRKSSKYLRIITERDLPEPSDYYMDCSFYLGMINFVDIKHKNDHLKARYYLENALKNGYSEARLFLDYINGRNTDKANEATVFKSVFEWHDRHQNGRHIKLIYNIGWMYDKGLGTEQDYEKAIVYYQIVIRKKPVPTYFELEHDPSNSYETKQECTTSIEWYKKEANRNIVVAYRNLGDMYFQGKGVEKNYKIAFQYYMTAAKNGDIDAQAQLGAIYHMGYEVKQDYTTAIEWYTKAANQNHLIANYNLGSIYYSGKGVNKDYKLASQYYATAAKRGHSDSQVQLGTMYVLNQGVPQNYNAAIYWYKRAANQYNIIANYNLGAIYFYGKGDKKDYRLSFKYYKFSADKGHSDSQNSLGIFYEHGYDVEQDYARAIKWYTKAANQSHILANYNLGNIHFYGKGVEKNYSLSFQYYKAAAIQGHGDSQAQLGLSYAYSYGVKRNYKDAIEWCTKAANQNSIVAYHNLGSIYLYCIKDYKLAFKFYKISADQNHCDSQAQLGLFFTHGYGVEQNYARAIKWYTKAANQKSLIAYYYLGFVYYYGQGVEKDYSLSFQNYKAAADQEHSDAQYDLGIMYENGEGVEQNYTIAIKWYTRAADQNHVVANYNLGIIYCYGRGVEKDYNLALHYFKAAANQGHSDAQNYLGIMYEKGDGVEQSYAIAIEWFTKAAKQNHVFANYTLGQMYFYGRGVEKDNSLAFQHHKVAASQGNSDAQNQLGSMYECGDGVGRNYTAAIEWFTKAANQNHIVASYNLGRMYYYGRVDKTHYKLSSGLHYSAIAQDRSNAQNELGSMCKYGREPEKTRTKAIEWFTKAAKQNHVFASYTLGQIYYYGQGEEGGGQDYKLAFEHYKVAADQEHSDALIQLGIMYSRGLEVETNYAMAAILFARASNQNIAMVKLGEAYHSIDNKLQNFSRAFECYNSIDKNDINISYALRGIGLLYEHGDSVEQNYDMAFYYYKQSAEKQNKGAYYNLALLYYYGKGVKKNYGVALEWFDRVIEEELKEFNAHVFVQAGISKDSGLSKRKQREYSMVSESVIYGEAHYYIGLMHKEGQGSSKNLEKALNHFRTAHSLGIERAQDHLDLEPTI